MSRDLLDDLSFLDNSYEAPEFIYAGFWKRVAATILDGIASSFILIAIQLFCALLGIMLPKVIAGGLYGFGAILVVLLYYPLFESSKLQATPGKYILEIQVINNKGGKISFLQGLARYLLKFISYVTLLIGFIMVAFTDKKQGMHDMIANTYVVERRK
jgi:uncharacterized RDD family membrane protein YckC